MIRYLFLEPFKTQIQIQCKTSVIIFFKKVLCPPTVTLGRYTQEHEMSIYKSV